jgi:glutamate 5-kinase
MVDLLRQEIAAAADLVVVKVGTRVLTSADGLLDHDRIAGLAEQIHLAMQGGRKVVLVSSGAVGAGMGQLALKQRPNDLAHLQAVAAIGQSRLVEAYDKALGKYGRCAAQVLLTAEDMDHRVRYLNVRNTLLTLMEYGAVPIINENDTVAVDELLGTFGDNDRLAALVTQLLRAPLLILLSDVEGLYDGDPEQSDSKVVATVTEIDDSIKKLARPNTSTGGRGGMASKLEAARIATAAGESVILASGCQVANLGAILAGEPVGTLFVPRGQSVSLRKRWIGYTVQPRGWLVIDRGAQRAVVEQGSSLLPIGVVTVESKFDKGDVIGLQDESGSEIGRGLTNYTAEQLDKIKGMRSDQIAAVLSHCPYVEVIHRDNLVVTAKEA